MLRMSLWSTAGFSFHRAPVSGNILAPLHGFNGHDREYALKVKHHICEELNMLKRDHNSQQHDDRDKVTPHPSPPPPARYDKYSCLPLDCDTRHHLHLPSHTDIRYILLSIWFTASQTKLASLIFPFRLLTMNLVAVVQCN